MPHFIPSLTHSTIKVPPLAHHKGNYTEICAQTSNTQAKESKRNRLETPRLLRQTQTFIGNTHKTLTVKERRIHEDTMVHFVFFRKHTLSGVFLCLCVQSLSKAKVKDFRSFYACVCMSGDKQGVDTQTHRGVRGQTTTFLTTLDTHTHS